MTFAIIGGDERQIYLYRRLRADGHTVRLCGFEKNGGHIPCVSVADALFGAHCIILPLPSSKDGKTVWMPLSDSEVYLSDITAAASSKALFLTAGLKLGTARECDYFAREELTVLNAALTAEGAISQALCNTPFSLMGARCLVIGFGRIGKLLCHRLAPFGCSITASSRREEVLSWIDAYGYCRLHTTEVGEHLGDFDIIFNTVPHPLLNEDELKRVKPGAIIIELASPPYGVDLDAAKRLGVNTLLASGLPAKTAPQTAADIIYDTVNNILKEHF